MTRARRERVTAWRKRPAAPLPRAPRTARPATYDRDTILARWFGCAYCNGPAEELDHVTPIAHGGRDVEKNLVGCCRRCNADKADQSLAEWLSRPPQSQNEPGSPAPNARRAR